MEESEQKKDTQARAYTIVINNNETKGMTHDKIKEILQSIPTLQYYCLCDEIGENKTPHVHIYLKARNPIKFSTMCNKFNGQAHVESARGTSQQNRDYVRKEGAYLESDKKETNLIETFEEFGTLPQSHQGQRNDLIEMYRLVQEGLSNAEILEICPETAIKHINKLDKLRHDYLINKYKGQRRLDLKVHYVSGKTGLGKSRDILDMWGDSLVYRVTEYKHPFDNYQSEPVLVFEEFRSSSSLRLQDMLNYLDIYPVTLPARYAPKVGCYHTVYVVSNWTFEMQYAEFKKDPEQKTSYEAWVRRFNGEVKIYGDNGIKVYPTMKDYLSRDEGFQTLGDNTKTPFDTDEKDDTDEPEQQLSMPFE